MGLNIKNVVYCSFAHESERPPSASLLFCLPASSPASPLGLVASHSSLPLPLSRWCCLSLQKDYGVAHGTGTSEPLGCHPANTHTDVQLGTHCLSAGFSGALSVCHRDSGDTFILPPSTCQFQASPLWGHLLPRVLHFHSASTTHQRPARPASCVLIPW